MIDANFLPAVLFGGMKRMKPLPGKKGQTNFSAFACADSSETLH